MIEEAKRKKADVLVGKKLNPSQIINLEIASVPIQPNGWDCGVYLVKNVLTLLDNPEKYTEYLLVLLIVFLIIY